MEDYYGGEPQALVKGVFRRDAVRGKQIEIDYGPPHGWCAPQHSRPWACTRARAHA